MEPHCLSTRSASLAGRDHGVHISVRPHGQRKTVEGVGGGGWARPRRQARHARGGGEGCGARAAAPLTPQVAAFPHLGRTCGASCRARDLSLGQACLGRRWAIEQTLGQAAEREGLVVFVGWYFPLPLLRVHAYTDGGAVARSRQH